MIVPPIAVAAALGSASLHAAWNVGIRGGSDRRASTAFLALASAVIGVIVLLFLPAPAAAAWPHLAVSGILHIVYFNLVAEAYSLGAVSLTYPVMRGVAPALTATIAALGFGEHLGIGGWSGLFLISLGVSLQARRSGRPGETRALLIALVNSVVVGLYTVNDGLGARLSHSPVAYAVWTFVLPAIPTALVLLRGRISLLFASDTVPSLLRRGVGGALCSIAAYSLALWAMTQAPIGAVAALRETAMLFGVLYAWWFLAESPGRRRMVALAVIAIGAVILDLG
jgi:drug/metabolite transporter (DMT)-like permease